MILLVVLAGGIPWALVRFIGSPVPGRWPRWTDIEAVLTAPLSPSLLIHILAVLCWLAWMTFLVDVVRSVPAAVRAARGVLPRPAFPRQAGPIHIVTATLVTAVAVAVLANRSPLDAAATDPATSSAPGASERQPDTPAGSAQRTVTVREPRDGIYDCLWRIADRELGDGARWPEIYDLNRGRPQGDGRALSDPDLIQPGWVLVLPDTAPTAPPEPDGSPNPEAQPPPTPSSPPQTPEVPSSPPPTIDDTAPPHTDLTEPPRGPADSRASPHAGIDLGPGAFIGIGAAAVLSAALLLAYRRRRRWYEPGSGHRADLPTAPVVRTLRTSRLRMPDLETQSMPARVVPGARQPADTTEILPAPPPNDTARSTAPPAGVRDGHQLAFDLARSHGLGLVGAGADDAARALLLEFLTSQTAKPQVVMTAADAEGLLEATGGWDQLPSRLRVVPDLASALDNLEREILHRAHIADDSKNPRPSGHPLVLVATPQPQADRRLQAILANGSPLGIVGILRGQWRPGGTAHVLADGMVNATNPGPAEQLRRARLFTLPAPATADLFAILRDADQLAPIPSTPRDPPAADKAKAQRPAVVMPSLLDPVAASTAPNPSRSAAALRWVVLGTPRLTLQTRHASQDITTALTPRSCELLVFLAIHPEGVTRDSVAESLWPDGPADRPANSLHTTLSRLRRALDTVDHDIAGIVTVRGSRYQLDPELVDVDYWHLARAVADSRTADNDVDRNAADRQIIATYSGELADGIHADWLDVPREATRRDAIDAAARLARTLIDTEPQQALRLLETARGFDPYNELIYRDIMRLQARLGEADAISRTLSLLTARLAELDERPDPTTVALAGTLEERN